MRVLIGHLAEVEVDNGRVKVTGRVAEVTRNLLRLSRCRFIDARGRSGVGYSAAIDVQRISSITAYLPVREEGEGEGKENDEGCIC